LFRWLWAITLLGLALRLAFVALEPRSRIAGDEITWVGWGTEPPGGVIAEKVRFSFFRNHMIFYPPIYPLFIGSCVLIFGSLAGVQLMQALIGALLIPAVGRVGAQLWSRTTGLWAAAAVAVYPELIWYSAHYWSETLFMTLLWWGWERLLAADQAAPGGTKAAPRWMAALRYGLLGLVPLAALWLVWDHDREAWAHVIYLSVTLLGWLLGLFWLRRGVDSRCLSAGVLFGLAVLTRETLLYFMPLFAAWLIYRRRGGLVRAGLLCVATLLVVAPWTYRNAVVFDTFIPVSTAGSLNLWQGNAPFVREEIYRQYDDVQGRIAQHRHARQKGIEAILARQPWWIFEKLRSELPAFWEVDSVALIHLNEKRAYGPVAPSVAIASAILIITPYILTLGGFIYGLAGLVLDRRRALLLGFLAYYVLIHVATHGFSRYRLPVMPIVFLVAATAVSGMSAPLSRLRCGMLILLIVVFLWALAPSVKGQIEMPIFRGAGHVSSMPVSQDDRRS
jgi:4-amino-4-deoxy-L-arabinose transferase-like glycosyltransferase